MKRFFVLMMAFLIGASSVASAKTAYVYRQRANWVKLQKLSSKQMAGQTLAHPIANLTADDIEFMLLSIEMNRKSLLKKGIDTTEVFSSFEARRFAPYIVQALEKAGPNEVVNMSIVHKRPAFILRNDYVSNINIYVNDEGVHFFFNKLFARLVGDYSQMSNIDESLKKAKTMRVNLDARNGQKIAFDNPLHIVMEPRHDFASDVAVEKEKDTLNNDELLRAKSKRKVAKDDVAPVPTTSWSSPAPAKAPSDTASRLRQLDQLKKDGLITPAEYTKKRQTILNTL
jgi:hypothetical protein